mgnify:CR=1 FL=1
MPSQRTARPQAGASWLGPVAILVAAAVLSPLAFLLAQAKQVGLAQLRETLLRGLTVELLGNTLGLTLAVALGTAVIGLATAWWLDRLSARAVALLLPLVVLPVAVPDFIVSFGWREAIPSLGGFLGAWLVMCLATYPLVTLPAYAALRGMDRGTLEVARSLGASRLARLWLLLGQLRAAVAGGVLLVGLVVLAEYGAFEILGFRTFTTEVFTQFKVGYNASAACALSLVLVVLGILAVAGDGLAAGRRPPLATSRRVEPRVHSGGGALLGILAVVVLGLGVPMGAVAELVLAPPPASMPGAGLISPLLHSAAYAGSAAILVTLAAIPVALLSRSGSGRLGRLLERATLLVMAVPGVVVALALTWASQQLGAGFGYQSPWLLVLAYAVVFFPLGLVSVRASAVQGSGSLEEVARSLGASRLGAFRRVTLPMLRPGLLASLSLVFLAALTELTATLLLIPTGASTLSTQFWAFETNAAYGQAAPFALAMVLLGAVPTIALSRYFDRRPSQQGVAP